tara:strand:- start:542 stop:817 length:276 start_codon:yes stop_codon:yes gene_type:complete
MDKRLVNLALFGIVLLLVVNLFYPLEYTGRVVEDLSCDINGNEVDNINLCCHEMQRFSKCGENSCVDGNYIVDYDEDVLDFCEDNNYDIRR